MSGQVAVRDAHFFDPEGITEASVPQVDYHMHTDFTDGRNTVEEMHGAAVDCGIEAILFSEHARKTSGDWFGAFAERVRALPRDQCRAYVGTECKVDGFAGGIDTGPDITRHCDLIMVSVHRFPDGEGGLREFKDVEPGEAMDIEFRLSCEAVANPLVDIIGHPFGMSLMRYRNPPSEDRWRTLIERAAKYDVAIDISGRYHPDPWQLIRWCREAGARVTLGSDAHSVREVGRITRILEGKETPWRLSAFS